VSSILNYVLTKTLSFNLNYQGKLMKIFTPAALTVSLSFLVISFANAEQ